MAEGTATTERRRLPLVRGPKESPRCGECPLARNGKPHKPVAAEGGAEAEWIIVGESPGPTEEREGHPFIGRSGKLLDGVLEKLGADRSRIWITNTTLCQPPRNKRGLDVAVECCAPRLDAELRQLPNRPILALGAYAARALLPAEQFKEYKATELYGTHHVIEREGPRSVIPTTHPAAILRGGSGGDQKKGRVGELGIWFLGYDAAKIHGLARGQRLDFPINVTQVIHDEVGAVRELEKMAAEIRRWGAMSIDIETTSTNHKADPLHCVLTVIGIAHRERSVSITYDSFNARAWRLFKELCEDPDIIKNFHYGTFDRQVLWRYGINFAGELHDTHLMHSALFPGAVHKLQRVTTQFYVIHPWKADFRHGDGTDEEETEYNGIDVLATERLRVSLDASLGPAEVGEVYEVDRRLLPLALRMTRVGIPISREENSSLRTELTEKWTKARLLIEYKFNDSAFRDRWVDYLALGQARRSRKGDPEKFLERHAKRVDEIKYGKFGKTGKLLKGHEATEFSPGNTDHVIAYLQALGCQLTRITQAGKLSGDKDVLAQFTEYEEVRNILSYRENTYLYAHYVKLNETGDPGEKGLILDDEDRIHPEWKLPLVTGRWASTPNVQNWAEDRARTGRPNMRRQVVARPGYRLVEIDKAQLEARIIGAQSADPLLVSIFEGGEHCKLCKELGKNCAEHDIHTVFSLAVWPDFLSMADKIRKELRDLVKRGEYGGFYGGAIETLFKSIVREFPKVKIEEVARIVAIIQKKMPGVGVWHAHLMDEAKKTLQICSALLGRPRKFPLGTIDMTVLYNHPVQATGADIVNLDILNTVDEFTRRGWFDVERRKRCKVEFLVQGHDSILLEVEENIAEEVKTVGVDCMTSRHRIGTTNFLYPAEGKVGGSWAAV